MYHIKTNLDLYSTDHVMIRAQENVDVGAMKEALKKHRDGTLMYEITMTQNDGSILIVMKNLTKKKANYILDELFKNKHIVIDF